MENFIENNIDNVIKFENYNDFDFVITNSKVNSNLWSISDVRTGLKLFVDKYFINKEEAVIEAENMLKQTDQQTLRKLLRETFIKIVD